MAQAIGTFSIAVIMSNNDRFKAEAEVNRVGRDDRSGRLCTVIDYVKFRLEFTPSTDCG